MDPPVRLAIVGSTKFQAKRAWWTAEWIIRSAIQNYHPLVVLSGGALGIDSLAKTVAHEAGYSTDDGSFVEYLPKVHRWGKGEGGFHDRNLLIAQDCTQLLRIVCHASTTYGSGFTADRAEELGKFVERVTL